MRAHYKKAGQPTLQLIGTATELRRLGEALVDGTTGAQDIESTEYAQQLIN